LNVDIPLPEKKNIVKLLEINLKDVSLDENVDLNALAEKLIGYSGADVTVVCRDAAMAPMRRIVEGLNPAEIRAIEKDKLSLPVLQADFETAINRIKGSISCQDIQKYENWMKEFGSA
jgi:katanin p60 ATPase-containing subunit A1